MSKALEINIKESVNELRALMRESSPLIAPRINMLLRMKKHGKNISRNKLSVMLGVSESSIQTWRKTYLEGGIEALTGHNMKGRSSKIFGPEERKFLEEVFNNPKNEIRGYAKLMKIMNVRFGKTFNYNTLREYCRRNFEPRTKTARKSGVKRSDKSFEYWTSSKSIVRETMHV